MNTDKKQPDNSQAQRPWHQRAALVIMLTVFCSACAVLANQALVQQFGVSEVRQRAFTGAETVEYHAHAKKILDARCIACHACYDAPCQLQLGSHEGIDRGAIAESVYDVGRLFADDPTRLFVDEKSTARWRQRDFYPVLNERDQSAQNNIANSLLIQVLDQKRQSPSPTSGLLPEDMQFGATASNVCARPEQFENFANARPHWGMPYGLPALSESEYRTLSDWVKQGSVTRPMPDLDEAIARQVDQWEAFFNEPELKAQLMARYIYEHLFLAHFYFDELESGTPSDYFQIVRSRTPPGTPVDIIASRRPYDDPRTDKFYYRLWRERATVVAKTHMPYALNDARMARWDELFLKAGEPVNELPSYDVAIAGNPFKAFKDIPVDSRYRFMLDEAQFSIMSYIRGPVCRGQVAVNVINDRFWVFFADPDHPSVMRGHELIEENADLLALPILEGSNASPLSVWTKYADLERERARTSERFINREFSTQAEIEVDIVWDGDGANKNAALTVFRNDDNAAVVKGLVGENPKTAWVIGYPLLENIHYLLVAGYDVYGNLGHNVSARLYMDFLRMEGEAAFLSFLPDLLRIKERDHWYRDAKDEVEDYIQFSADRFNASTAITYTTDDPKAELFDRLKARLGTALDEGHNLDAIDLPEQQFALLKRLGSVVGRSVRFMPEFSYLTIESENGDKTVSVFKNTALSNVAYLFGQEDRRLPAEDSITVAAGFIGTYPNAFFRVDASALEEFVAAVETLENDTDYADLASKFGVRRTNPLFWTFSDQVHDEFKANYPVKFGMLDYNRLENR